MKKTDIAASQPSYEEILRKERRANSAWNKLRRNKTAMIGLFIIVIMTAIAVFAPFITGGKPNEIHPIDAYLGFFEKGHLFGTDEAGRDLFTRICYGARVSLLVAVGATVLGGVIGVALGLISGYAGGVVDAVIMRCMDGVMAFPFILLLIVKKEEYCNAGRVIGISNTRMLLHHILPNTVSEVIVYATLNTASAIISEASLSFLGLGIKLPTASWGSILRSGRDCLNTAPHIAGISGCFILLTVIGFNLLGDGIRDVLDPKMRR